jgi:signal peptide peptidase SppA
MHDEILAIHEPTWAAISEVLELQRRGVNLTPAQAAERAGVAQRAPALPVARAIAVIPLFGLLTHRRGGFLSFLFGGTSLSDFTSAVRAAAAEPAIAAVVLLVDSPGGEVQGTPEAADAVADLRKRKRVVAIGDGLLASAAFWIASQAHEIIASPSSLIGSIGVISVHVDQSAADERAGLRTTVLTSSKRKAEGHPHAPLDADARAYLQSRVDQAGAMFTAAVARGRGVDVSRVRGPDFGEGRAFWAEEATRRGLADRLGTVHDVLAREASLASYEHAKGWHDTLRARGIESKAPVHPDAAERAERMAQYRLRIAETGL